MPTRARVLLLTAIGALVATFAAVTVPALAVSTRQFRIDDAASLSAGELDGTAVLSGGQVVVGVGLRRIELPNVAVAYSYARGADGAVYIGTGQEGKILRVRGDEVSVLAETQQLLVASLAVGDGTLYAGTLPEGRIYAVDLARGEMRELVRPEGAEHVWALAWDARRRVLYAGTGPEAKVFSITPQGRAEVYWDGPGSHVMSLALDGQTLYAGTSDEALVVRLTGPGRAEVVHDFPGNEITAIAAREGRLAVAANEFADPPASGAASKSTTGAASKTKSSNRPRPGKGRLWTVGSDSRVERVYQNDDGHFAAVQMAEDGTIYVGAGNDGRVYRVSPDRTSATWIDVDERQVLAIDLTARDPMFLTGDAGAMYRVLRERPHESVWTSKVLDARWDARWGEIAWRGDGRIQIQTRSGNTNEPGPTWSEWSAPMTTQGPIRSPAGRFLQIRARFDPAQGAATVLRAVTAYYLPQNQRAVVRNVGLKAPSGTDTPADALPAPSARYTLTWQVDNDDSDTMRYRLRFRAEDQDVWREMLREHEPLTATEYTWDTASIPDGWYVVQVEASDEQANPEALTLRATGESEPLLIDNHAPRVEGLEARGTTVTGRAIDTLGPIAKLEYAVDGGEWKLFFPSDHLFDTAAERFELNVGALSAGSHIIAVRATDSGGNVGSAEAVVRIGR